MLSHGPRRWPALVLALAAGLLLAGCASRPPSAAPTGSPRLAPATPVAVAPISRATAAADAALSPRTVIRTYADAQGRAVTLYHGRGLGRRGDWGWAHILGKHLYGEWHDGGPVTTFTEVGITTPEGVLDAIGRSLQDASPSRSGDRREYRVPVAGGRYELLTVVGGDGAIITAYPDPVAGGR